MENFAEKLITRKFYSNSLRLFPSSVSTQLKFIHTPYCVCDRPIYHLKYEFIALTVEKKSSEIFKITMKYLKI